MIQNLKDLEKLFKLCRKQGVTELDLGEVKFKLGELPYEADSNQKNLADDPAEDPYKDFPQGALTPEQLMFYSSGGDPKDDPYREDT